MSFDLFVLVERYDAQVQLAWVQRLQQVGLACTFPPGFSLEQIDESAPLPVCTIGPPLVEIALKPQSVGLYVESSEAEREDIDRMRKGADAALDRKLAASKREFHFASSAGRSDPSLLLQCYGAAALADVTNGVLVDPQESGAVHGAAVYDVAKANSGWALAPAASSKPPSAKSWWQSLFGG